MRCLPGAHALAVRAGGINSNNTYMIKNLIFSCLVTMALVSLAGCASDDKHSSTTDSSATTMTVDSKDISHTSQTGSH